MKSYTIEWYGSGEVREIFAANDTDAELAALEIVDVPGAVAADQWDADGRNECGEHCKRLLIWDNESVASWDDGSRAIAQLCTVGRA